MGGARGFKMFVRGGKNFFYLFCGGGGSGSVPLLP